MFRQCPTSEILITKPSALNSWKWVWSVYLPDVQGQPDLANGIGSDYEDCWRKAVIAREYIYKYGINK